MIVSVFLLVAAVVGCAGGPSSDLFRPNHEQETSKLFFGRWVFDGVVFHLYNRVTDATEPVTFLFDVGVPYALMGDADKIGSGVTCTEDIGCTLEPLPVHDFWYGRHYLQVKESKIHLRVHKDRAIELADGLMERPQMPWRLIVGPGEWLFEDWGVVGLTPTSVLTRYLMGLSNGPLSFLPYYKRVNDELDFRLFFRPVFHPDKAKATAVLPAPSAHWAFKAVLRFSDEPLSRSETTFCIHTQADDVVLMFHKADQCFRIHRLICNGRFGSNCNRHNADLRLAPRLLVVINGAEFVFAPDEYLHYDENTIHCRFGDMTELITSDACPPQTKYAIGKAFLEKYPAAFEVNRDETASITFLSEFNAPRRITAYFWHLVGAGLIMAALGVLVITLLIWRGEYKPPTREGLTESLACDRDSMIHAEHSDHFRLQPTSIVI